jgi:carboxymethylenebutenolidase
MIKIPLQGHFANNDDWCTPAAADGLEASLKACGATYELYRYDANHGFCNDRSVVNYDAASCNQAFERLQAFLLKHLA